MNFISDIQTLGLTLTAAITSIFALGNMDVIKTPNPLPTPSAQIQTNVVTKSGEYSYAGKKINYTLNIPRDGGKITGSVDGSCRGPITGNFDGKEGGDFAGKINVTCFFAFIKKSLDINYNGKLYLNEGRADLSWQGEIPMTEDKGNFTLNFEPE